MERRILRFHDFDQVWADADALLATGYERAGEWSLAQIADHLGKVIALSLDGFPSRFPWPMRLLARWFALGSILKHKPTKRRFSAPSFLMPTDASDDREAVARFRAIVARFVAHTGPLHPSPLFGTLSKDEWREVHLWHCEHHLSFLLGRMKDEPPAQPDAPARG